MIVLPIGALRGVETNNLWILLQILCKSDCLLQILSYVLGQSMKFSPSAT